MRLVPRFKRSHPRPALRTVDSASRTALLFTSALQLGYQATQSIVIYPELFAEPSNLRGSVSGRGHSLPETIAERQRGYVRRSVPMLATLYPMLGTSAVWAALTSRDASPGRSRLATWVAAAAAVSGPAITAGLTTRLHASVADDPTPGRVHSLLATDRVRTVVSAIGVIAALRSVQPG